MSPVCIQPGTLVICPLLHLSPFISYHISIATIQEWKKNQFWLHLKQKNMTDKLLPLGFLSLKCLCVESVIIECLYKMLSSYLKCLSVLLSDLQIHTFWKPTHGAFHLLFNVHILIWPVMQSHRIHGAVVVTVTTKMKNWNADLLGMNICRCCHKMFLRRHTVFTWLCH